GRVEDHVTGGKLHRVGAVGVVHHQFAAIVLPGAAQEQGRGEVGPDALRRARELADGVVALIHGAKSRSTRAGRPQPGTTPASSTVRTPLTHTPWRPTAGVSSRLAADRQWGDGRLPPPPPR